MSTKQKQQKPEDGDTSVVTSEVTYTHKINPVLQQKGTINITRVAGHGSGNSYDVKRSQNYGPASAPSGAYQQLSHMGADNLQKSRAREKKDMQELNERLANYIEKVRFLEAQNRKLVADLENLRSKWGKETAHIKAMYEAELAAARKLLDDSEKGKAELELRVQALMEEIQELSKNNEDLKKDVAADKETIERQNQQLSDYEAELQGLRRRVANLDKEQRKDKETIKKLQEELARCKQDLDNETLNRVCAENDRQSLQEELDFLRKVHEQEMKELAALAYRDTTPENREFWKNEMAQCLHELQAEYEIKMDGMRGELESYYNAKLQEFRTGATRNNMESTHTKDELKRLRTQLNDLRSKITDLEAKNSHLEKLLQELQREYDEKTREWELERSELESENSSLRAELESVLQELQNLLDAKLSLELEIAAYRKLLEGEETRIGLRNVVEQVVTTQEVEQSKHHGKKIDTCSPRVKIT